MEKTKRGFIKTILYRPFAFTLVTHTILQIIECARTGKVTPFINVTINVNAKESDTDS